MEDPNAQGDPTPPLGPTYGSPTVVRRKSGLKMGLLIAGGFVAFMAFTVIYSMNSPKTKYTIGKSKMTRADVNEAREELRDMVGDGDGTQFDTSQPTKTQIGKKLMELAKEGERSNRKLEEDLKDIDFEEILGAKTIGTADDRAKAVSLVAKYGKVMSAFYSETTARLDDFQTWSREHLGEETEDVRSQRAEFQALIKAHGEFVAAVQALFNHAEKKDGRYEPKSNIVLFKSVEDTKTYHKLYLKVVAAQAEMTRIGDAITKRSQDYANALRGN